MTDKVKVKMKVKIQTEEGDVIAIFHPNDVIYTHDNYGRCTETTILTDESALNLTKHHCKCRREAAKLDNISSLLEGIEDALVLKALLDLRADPDKRLSLWKGNQTANDIIRNKINVLLAAGAADVNEQTKLVESGKTPSAKQNTKLDTSEDSQEVIEDEDTHNQIRIYVDVKENKNHD